MNEETASKLLLEAEIVIRHAYDIFNDPRYTDRYGSASYCKHVLDRIDETKK